MTNKSLSLDLILHPEAAEVLRTKGKSFHFASQFLPPEQRKHGAALYAFCRRVDDLADESLEPEIARNQLAVLKQDLEAGTSQDCHTASFLQLARATDMSIEPAIELVRGVQGDLEPVRILNDAALIRYGYRVAGSVGLMMAHILGATDPRAPAHAIDLGIAMQLTNIARDVAEDGINGRRYLPASRVGNLDPDQCANPNSAEREQVQACILSVLDLAEEYYASGIAGLRYLPDRSAAAIYVAAKVYRAIGIRIRRAEADVWATRHYVPLPAKIGVALGNLPSILAGRHGKPPIHDSSLHGYIADLPGSDESSAWVAA